MPPFVWNDHGINGFVVSVVGLEGKSRLRVFIWFVFVSGFGFLNFEWLMSSSMSFDFFFGSTVSLCYVDWPWYVW